MFLLFHICRYNGGPNSHTEYNMACFIVILYMNCHLPNTMFTYVLIFKKAYHCIYIQRVLEIWYDIYGVGTGRDPIDLINCIYHIRSLETWVTDISYTVHNHEPFKSKVCLFFFDIRIVIAPLVSPNSSYRSNLRKGALVICQTQCLLMY
jgi:hypothetical protein